MIGRLVLASGNAGKLRELCDLLAPLAIEVLAQGELGIGDADEPHVTFVENALAKARHASRQSGLPALADDSGVCVHALGGAPGVHSARYAGEPRSDARNNAKLVADLEGQADRRAHYACVLVLVRRHDDPEPLVAEGRWYGRIVDTPRGSGGFGYDPHFAVDGTDLTAAELPQERKNRVSHRGAALRSLLAQLREVQESERGGCGGAEWEPGDHRPEADMEERTPEVDAGGRKSKVDAEGSDSADRDAHGRRSAVSSDGRPHAERR